MATTSTRKGGRKSKGDRKLVGSRMPVDAAQKLEEVAEASGQTISDYVAELVMAHLSTIDFDVVQESLRNRVRHVHAQEALPIARAS